MIEEKEELQGQLIASGQIVGSIVGCKGEKGDKGDKGNQGNPGFSPIANISKTGKIATITITDSQGTTTAEIRDGEDGSGSGDMLKATYDTNDNGIVDNAEKVNNHTVQSDVPANAVFTDTTYTAGTGIEITAGNVINNTQTSAEWGNISGTLADQTDLNTALGNKIDKSNTTGLVKNDGTIDTTTYSTFSGSYNDLSNKPTIPDELADLSDDSTHRVVTDTEKNTWSGKQDALVSGTNIKTINSTSLLGSGNLDVGASIPVQDTAPLNPSEDDLWIDTSEPAEMQEAIKNEYSESTSDTYSCDYTNDNFQLKPYVLFNDTSASYTSATLYDSISNYSIITIIGKSTDGTICSTTIYNPQVNDVIALVAPHVFSISIYNKQAEYKFSSETTITSVQNYQFEGFTTISQGNYIKLKTIIGWK